MINVNALVTNVLRSLNVVGQKQSPVGDKADAAVDDLNGIIQELNKEEYISDCVHSYFVSAGSTITIGLDESADIKIEPPAYIKTLSRKIGNKYVRLIKSDMDGILSTQSSSLATLYTYNVHYDEEKDCMLGVITLNGRSRSKFSVTLIETIPEVDINTNLHLQNIYKSVLECGLKLETAKRYKMKDWIAQYQSDFDDAKDTLKTINSNNRPMVFSDGYGSYNDTYYAALAGEDCL